jgi:hypothetical protein
MTEARDADRLLGFGGWGAWAIYAAYAATVLILALNGGRPSESPAGIAATIAALAAGLIGILPGPYPLPLDRTTAVVTLTAFCNVAITVQLSPDVWPGWASWNFGLTAIALVSLSLRGRILASWIGLGLMAGIAIAWSWIAGGSPKLGFDLIYMHLGVNLATTFFALGLRRAVQRIQALRAVESEREMQLAAREAAEAERAEELRVLSDEVEPTLRRIAAGVQASDDDAAAYRVLEAKLRDRIRARRLDQPHIRAAVDAARRRGGDVLLLDDLGGDAAPTGLDAALTWASGLLSEVGEGTTTVRLSDPGVPELTVVADSGVRKVRVVATSAEDDVVRP